MATYYVDDGGSATAPYDTWAKAATSLSALDDAVSFAFGDVIYIGHDHVCPFVHTASRSIAGPAASGPGVGVTIISATTGSDPPTYQKATSTQVDTSEGTYFLDFDGSFSIYGVRMRSGSSMRFIGPTNGKQYHHECHYILPANGAISVSSSTSGEHIFENCTLDLTNDGTTNRTASAINVGSANRAYFTGLTLINPGYRTDYLASNQGGVLEFSGCDFSGLTHASVPELIRLFVSGLNFVTNCLFPATLDYAPATSQNSHGFFTNCGAAYAPEALTFITSLGSVLSSADIYRSGGATIESVPTAWLITTTASAFEGKVFRTPWMHGLVSSTGSKNFDVFITNDTADFTDAEVWLEVEYLGTADEMQWAHASDRRASITATAADQDDDTTSTWNGSGPSFTYKQRLRVTATVNEAGRYRARVCVGVTNIASSRYFYVDPTVTVS